MDAPVFNKLPEELLDSIVQSLPSGKRHADLVAQLRVLRLVRIRFAYLKRILRTMFSNIQLVGSHDANLVLSHGITETIVPYVERITFVPPPDDWIFSTGGFVNLIKSAMFPPEDKQREGPAVVGTDPHLLSETVKTAKGL